MIYAPGQHLFIHIPRTAGVSIKTVYMRHRRPNDVYLIQMCDRPYRWRRHTRAVDVFPMIPDWYAVKKFAVIRSPWTVIPSTYFFWRQLYQEAGNAVPLPIRKEAEAAMRNPFCDWVPLHFGFLSDGEGLWYHFCLSPGGGDLGIEPFKFEQLNENWSKIRGILGLPEDAQLPKINAAKRSGKVEWTSKCVRWVQDHFADDIRRFGYPTEPAE